MASIGVKKMCEEDVGVLERLELEGEDSIWA